MRNPNSKIQKSVVKRQVSDVQRKGFTLIETLVALGILASLAGLGFFMSIGQYKTYVLDSDMNTLGSLLQRARSLSMNNVNSAEHGVFITGGNYILFQGSSYASRNTTYDEPTPISRFVSASGPAEIVFRRLRGDLAAGTGDIVLDNGSGTRIITLNGEGRISW